MDLVGLLDSGVMTDSDMPSRSKRSDPRLRGRDVVVLVILALAARAIPLFREKRSAAPKPQTTSKPLRTPSTRRPPNRPLGTDRIADRLDEQRATHHLGLYNVMKGTTLAVAGLALLKLLVEEPSLQRVLLLAVALTAALLGYYAATVGGPVVNFRPSVLDIALPMALTLAELVLIGRTSEKPIVDGAMPADWLLVLCAWQVLAGFMVGSVAFRLKGLAYAPELQMMAARYRRRQFTDFALATAQAALTFCFWLLRHDVLPTMRWPEYAFIVVTLLMFSMAIRHQGATSREIERLAHNTRKQQLSDRPLPTPAAAPPGPPGL